MSLEGVTEHIKKAVAEVNRILRSSRKPRMTEYTETLKVTGVGILLIGFIGFIILMISELIRGV